MPEKIKGNLEKIKQAYASELDDLFFEVKSNFKPEDISLKITGIYLLFGGMWIAFSDRILGSLVNNKQTMTEISIIKGWIYVIVTGIIIYFLILKSLRNVKKVQQKLIKSNDELAATFEELEASYDDLSSMENELKNQYNEILLNQEQLHNLAYNDQMTNLPNRLNLYETVGDELLKCRKLDSCCAVLYVDTDNFKMINDSLGHSFGDKFIKETANRLSRFVTISRRLYRLGGDEMIFFLSDVKNKEEVELFAQKIISSYREPYDMGGTIFHITASIGIAMYPKDGESIEQLLKNADMAMYRAKDKGKNGYRFF